MNKARKQFRIGILPGMADLYNRLSPGLSEELIRFFNHLPEALKIDNLKFIIGNLVSTKKQVEAECEKLVEQDVDLLMVTLASYCPSGVLVPGLLTLEIPVLLWPVQSMFKLEPGEYNSAMIRLNHGVHGVQDLANVLRKNSRDFGVIHGHWQQNGFREELLSWARASRAVRAMRKANPVQIGGHFEDMLDLQIGSDEFIEKSGLEYKEVSLDKFSEALAKIEAWQTEQYISSYRSVFDISNKLNDKILYKTAKGEAALRVIMKQYQSYACGLNFLELCNDKRISDPLHVAGSVLISEGYGYAGEGDWITAAFIYSLQQAFGKASFSEIFSVDYAGNQIVLKHWGEGNFAMAREKPRLLHSELTDINKADFAIADFEFEPGRSILINLSSTPQGQGQLISVTGSITHESLPKAEGPRAVFKPECNNVRELLTSYAYHGGSHHLALVKSDDRGVLEKMSRLSGWEYINL